MHMEFTTCHWTATLDFQNFMYLLIQIESADIVAFFKHPKGFFAIGEL